MKKLQITIILLFVTLGSFAQNLKIADLLYMYKQTTWEDVNTYLSNKKWVYYNSEYESEIQWTYKRAHYEEKAQGWFYLKLNGAQFSSFRYQMAQQMVYNQLINELKTLGFKKKNSNIRDGSITTSYTNGKYNIYTWINKADDNSEGNNYQTIEIEKIRPVYNYENDLVETSSSANTNTSLTQNYQKKINMGYTKLNTNMITKWSTSLRKGAYPSFEILEEIPKASIVKVYGVNNDGTNIFYEVEYNKRRGYIYYLDLE